jgi:hypothetical protein
MKKDQIETEVQDVLDIFFALQKPFNDQCDDTLLKAAIEIKRNIILEELLFEFKDAFIAGHDLKKPNPLEAIAMQLGYK